MRTIVQFQVIEGSNDRIIYALDNDGILWCGNTREREVRVGDAFACDWVAVQGPGDDEPFIDRRSQLDKLEDKIREAEREREAILSEKESETDTGGTSGEAGHQSGDG